MLPKIWQCQQQCPEDIQEMAESLSISPLTATVLLGRGISDVDQARQWLSLDEPLLHDPFLIPDMEPAIHRLHHAITHGERICCYGDYDVDGISASSLYLLGLREYGATCDVYIPDRQTEGYGLNISAIRALASQGVTVLITVDCGTTSHEEVLLAKQLGMDMIITDHHQLQGEGPEALAFLNPYRQDSQYPFKGLCSCGLAYKVIKAYASLFGHHQEPPSRFLDLVALATIADVVPLQDENRWLVRNGLEIISGKPRPGIQALKRQAGIDETCTAGMIAFQLAPMLNAAGRLAKAMLGVDLLTCPSAGLAETLAGDLNRLNRQRREIERAIFEAAVKECDADGMKEAMVVGARDWHMGVVGIVASRLVERYHRPAVVIAFGKDGRGRGSLRSIPGLDICQVLSHCSDLLEGWGGHPAAAGINIREQALPQFRERFTSSVASHLKEEICRPILHIDAKVALREIDPLLLQELGHFQPFGMGNPEPTFMATQLTVLEQRIVGNDHLKLVVRQPHSSPFESIGFRMAGAAKTHASSWSPIDLAFIPEQNRWRGLDKIQLRIRDVRVSKPTGQAS